MGDQPKKPDRIQRVEEEVAFAGHGLDALGEQMLAFQQKLEAMASRIEKLEFRLHQALAGEEQPTDDEAQPSSD